MRNKIYLASAEECKKIRDEVHTYLQYVRACSLYDSCAYEISVIWVQVIEPFCSVMIDRYLIVHVLLIIVKVGKGGCRLTCESS